MSDGEAVWLNEPARWRRAGSDLLLTTDPDTDFWRQTHYGFTRDSGHHFGMRVPGEFTCEVAVTGEYRDQYDQAGLMIRLDAERWVKCGIELVDGACTLSTVVTHAVSDWSTTPLPGFAAGDGLRLRVRRHGDALTVEYSAGGGEPGGQGTGGSGGQSAEATSESWTTSRMAYLPPGLPVSVGPMAASPQGSGFDVRFRDWTIGP